MGNTPPPPWRNKSGRELLAQSRELLKQVQAGRTVRLTVHGVHPRFLSHGAVAQVIGYESPFRRPRTTATSGSPDLIFWSGLGSATLREFGRCVDGLLRGKTLARLVLRTGMISNTRVDSRLAPGTSTILPVVSILSIRPAVRTDVRMLKTLIREMGKYERYRC
jgi:hypothetical protein